MKNEIYFSQRKFIPFYNIKKAGNTVIFQGNNKKKNYFEGWYFKMVSQDESSILSVIPGISISSDGGEQHAFIQIINGITAETAYYSFPIEEFSFSKKEFALKIADNYFSEDSLILNIENDSTSISGKVFMTGRVVYESDRWVDPGIMGFYRFVPFMECYHGVVSLTHGLEGQLAIHDEQVNFSGGKGYIEKDWGSSMPSSWIWMQSNHFSEDGASLMLSIANIPWLRRAFTGFLGFYYHHDKIYHFATYRQSDLQLEIEDSDQLKIRIENKEEIFIIEAGSNSTGMLKAPVKGAMDRRIPESIDAEIKITMMDKMGNILSVDSTDIAGLEMVGDYHELPGSLK